MKFIIGQIFGLVALAFTTLSYQTRSSKKLLVLQTIATALFSIHYFLIGATSGLALNLVAILRNLIYYNRDKNLLPFRLDREYCKGWFFPCLMTLCIGIMGAFSWQAWYSLLIIIGLMINTMYLSVQNPQTIRKSILLTSTMILIYDIFVSSYGGIINEALAITSSVIGIVRMGKPEEK